MKASAALRNKRAMLHAVNAVYHAPFVRARAVRKAREIRLAWVVTLSNIASLDANCGAWTTVGTMSTKARAFFFGSRNIYR